MTEQFVIGVIVGVIVGWCTTIVIAVLGLERDELD